MPPAVNGTTLTFTFIGPLGRQTRTYLVDSTKTPAISLTSSNPINSGPNTITVTRTDTQTSTVVSINLISKVNPAEIKNIPAWTTNAGAYTFTTSLTAGAYIVQLLTTTGYASFLDTINVNIPTNAAATPLVSSFAGGLLTVTGDNLSPSSFIVVNGLRGDIKTYSASSVVYNAPALVTTNSQSTFMLEKVGLIDTKAFVVDSDALSTNSSAAFDGLSTTFYGSTHATCFIRMSLTANLQATIERVRFFPNLNWMNTARMLLNAVFEGSNDGIAWTNIGTADQTVHSGWNIIKSKTSTPFKFIRFAHTSDSMCNIA